MKREFSSGAVWRVDVTPDEGNERMLSINLGTMDAGALGWAGLFSSSSLFAPFPFARKLLVLIALAGIGAVCALAQEAPPADHTAVLHAARLLDVTTGKLLEPGEILVQGERIAKIGSKIGRAS